MLVEEVVLALPGVIEPKRVGEGHLLSSPPIDRHGKPVYACGMDRIQHGEENNGTSFFTLWYFYGALSSEEPVSMQTDWFTLREACLQLRPYSYPHFEIAVAATVSPAGPRTAGRYGVGLLSLGATSMGGFAVLGDHWKIWNDQAQAFGHQVERSTWRLVGPMHVAPTRKQAFEEVEYGIHDWIDYFRNVVALPLAPGEPDPRKWPQALVESGTAVIGTPDDAAAQLERLKKQSGGFGCFLIMAQDWVERRASLASYELLAKEVFPRFQGSADLAVRSREWCRKDHDSLIGGAMNAVVKEIERYEKETGYRVAVASLAQSQRQNDT